MNNPDGLSKKQLLLFLGFLFAFIVIAVFSSILGSKVHTQKNDLPPEAYGLDTFEENAPTVLHVSVWQRNEKSKSKENDGRIITNEVEGKYYNKTQYICREIVNMHLFLLFHMTDRSGLLMIRRFHLYFSI